DIIIATDKKFHIAGQVQHKDLWRYFWWKLRRHGSADRVYFHGWQNDVNAWLDDVDANYLISTSWSESFAYNIAEAMAKGIKPVIRNFEAAEELWPTRCIYNNIEEAIDLFNETSYESKSYRQWVADRYDSEHEAKQYLDLFFGKDVQ
ncbi:MAG: glycosyltransferase family 4 protein, partial [Chlorobiales bacterium]|nr:glycosyltransferase family 4 protein [Chlorobiales bacterium]